jgi:hypothetical protein
MIAPHRDADFDQRDENEDERNADQREFNERVAVFIPSSSARHHVLTLIWTERLIVNCGVNPGMGNTGSRIV